MSLTLRALVLLVSAATASAQTAAVEVLEPFVGAYRSSDGRSVRVMLVNGGLVYRSEAASAPLRQTAPRVFESMDERAPVRLSFGDDHASRAVDIRGPAVAFAGRRVVVPEALLQSYGGSYPLSDTLEMRVTFERGRLHVQAPGASKHPLFPESDTRFFVQDYQTADVAELEFGRDGSGTAYVVVRQGGSAQKATRK